MSDFTAPDVPGFHVGRMLGSGGSSTVWLVTEAKSGNEFALKCLGLSRGRRADGRGAGPTGDFAEDDIRREIRILSGLQHQHLIKAHDAVRFAPKPGMGAPGEIGDGVGLLLDYAPGGSLADLVGSRRKLPVGETVTVLTPIAQVLGYLHAQGFTHGDVSPGNVLFSGHGKPLLSDVGIARMVGDAAPVAQHGTSGFMDPAPVDAVRAGLQPERDVYSVAALGWYCLTGEPPRRTVDRPPLSLLLPDVPPELAAALEAGLNEDRRLRPSAVEFATAIYRSAPPLPVDLASSVHATVIPQLLTRRRIPDRRDGAALTRIRAWGRKLSTSRWSALVGIRQRLPFPAGEVEQGSVPARGRRPRPRGKHSMTSGPRRLEQDLAPGIPAIEDPGAGDGARQPQGIAPQGAVQRRRTLLLLAGAVAVAAGVIWTAGAFGPGGPLEGRTGPRQLTGAGIADGTGPAYTGRPAEAGSADTPIPSEVADQLAAADPAVAVHGLAAVRSLAFSSGRLELLDLVNAPESPAAAVDARIKGDLEGSGHLLAGFTSTVTNARVQPGSTPERAVVGVTSATSSYVQQDTSGQAVATEAPGTHQVLRLVLVRQDGQWRISDVLPGS